MVSWAQLFQPCPLPASRAAPGHALAGPCEEQKRPRPCVSATHGHWNIRVLSPLFSSQIPTTALHQPLGRKLTSFQPKHHTRKRPWKVSELCAVRCGGLLHRRIQHLSGEVTAFCSARHEEKTQRKMVSAAETLGSLPASLGSDQLLRRRCCR